MDDSIPSFTHRRTQEANSVDWSSSFTNCRATFQAIMVKIHLVASAIVICASVCSALDLWVDYNYQGTMCHMDTPHSQCLWIPQPCNQRAYSIGNLDGWRCRFYLENNCVGAWRDATHNEPRLGPTPWKSVSCWVISGSPHHSSHFVTDTLNRNVTLTNHFMLVCFCSFQPNTLYTRSALPLDLQSIDCVSFTEGISMRVLERFS
ncbi:hypothetical protein B0O80DRAFT_430733 [Mortierella sp. GBAus27b]|nr:hypothetical protein B0O80DRAFT_430733 [Mortierella sp. GBAus27b]